MTRFRESKDSASQELAFHLRLEEQERIHQAKKIERIVLKEGTACVEVLLLMS